MRAPLKSQQKTKISFSMGSTVSVFMEAVLHVANDVKTVTCVAMDNI